MTKEASQPWGRAAKKGKDATLCTQGQGGEQLGGAATCFTSVTGAVPRSKAGAGDGMHLGLNPLDPMISCLKRNRPVAKSTTEPAKRPLERPRGRVVIDSLGTDTQPQPHVTRLVLACALTRAPTDAGVTSQPLTTHASHNRPTLAAVVAPIGPPQQPPLQVRARNRSGTAR